MEQPRGRVISIAGSDPDRRALVEVDPAAACPRCAAGRGCGAGLGRRAIGARRVEATLPPGAEVTPGDVVSIELQPRNVLTAATIVYGWPLAGAATGAGIAYLAAYGDAAAAAAALAGLAVGGVFVRHRLGEARCLSEFTPRVVG